LSWNWRWTVISNDWERLPMIWSNSERLRVEFKEWLRTIQRIKREIWRQIDKIGWIWGKIWEWFVGLGELLRRLDEFGNGGANNWVKWRWFVKLIYFIIFINIVCEGIFSSQNQLHVYICVCDGICEEIIREGYIFCHNIPHYI
jgi:hypothetical protein